MKEKFTMYYLGREIKRMYGKTADGEQCVKVIFADGGTERLPLPLLARGFSKEKQRGEYKTMARTYKPSKTASMTGGFLWRRLCCCRLRGRRLLHAAGL